MLYRILSLTFALLLPAFPLTPAHAAPPVTAATASISKIASVEGITEYRLHNGLKVLLFPDASQDTITVNLTYLVGSRHEGYGEHGMAHLLEHMQFKGTPRHPDIKNEFQRRGAHFNASTSYDRTNYYETLAANYAGKILAAAAEDAKAAGVACETRHVSDRHPSDGILEAAKDAGCDLIVMSSNGRRGFKRLLLGSQATAVLTRVLSPGTTSVARSVWDRST